MADKPNEENNKGHSVYFLFVVNFLVHFASHKTNTSFKCNTYASDLIINIEFCQAVRYPELQSRAATLWERSFVLLLEIFWSQKKGC